MLFVALPIGLGVAVWFPNEVQGWGWLAGVATACGLTYFFAETAADAGRRKQPGLWQEWSGSPTTIHLRHSTSPLNPHTLARYHDKLSNLRPDLKIPTREEEQADPPGANSSYESCVDYLREATRDTGAFAMVFSDNVNYGYRRNLWAIKPAGVATCIAGMIACAARVIHQRRTGGDEYAAAAACGAACMVILLLFATVVTKSWVRQAGDSYALRLLAALEKL